MKFFGLIKGGIGGAGLVMLAGLIQGQVKPDSGPAPEVIRIVQPVVDKAAGGAGGVGGGRVTLPTAFWNEKVAEWLDVAVCGRPSDFLHETVVSVTTTRTLLEAALREAGFHDADAWVSSVKDFPRIRGDRMLILVEFMRDGKKETYSLDELLEFREWGVAAGAYGFEFRGDPEHRHTDAAAPGDPPVQDATKILRDDPQIAVTFRGIQSVSQSFADHPLAYDDWIYPMMKFGRNPAALSDKIYDSNGDVPATLIIQKVGEEEFLKESARVWHDEAFRQFILRQVPVGQEIDKEKKAYWDMEGELAKIRAARAGGGEKRDEAKDSETIARATMTAANIEKGYATLDAAWGAWAADHATFPHFLGSGDGPPESAAARAAENKQILGEMKAEAARWKAHLALKQTSAEERAIAEGAAYQQIMLAQEPESDASKLKLAKLRGDEIAARSAAMLADNKQPRERWESEKEHLQATKDPREEWIKQVNQQVELADAREDAGTTGVELGRAMAAAGDVVQGTAGLQAKYLRAQARMQLADLRMQLTDVEFEISKREGLADDPDLAGLKSKKDKLEGEISQLEAATRPAP